jgi:cell wall-associated NlpC family hydrolase
MKQLKTSILFGLMLINIQLSAKKALVMVPVADIIGNPIATFNLAPTAAQAYECFSISGGPGNSSLECPRIHQLLFNETVDIVSEQEDEVAIHITSAYFITHTNHKPQTLYWTLKKNLISYEKLQRKKLPLSYIPPTPDFNTINEQKSAHVIGLLQPFHDPNTQQTFSAGTQFVYDPEKSTDSHFLVHLFDKTTTTFITASIARTTAVIIEPKGKNDATALFIQILKGWAHPENGIIPYVWGGCSFCYTCTTPIERKPASDTTNTLYHRPDCSSPYNGYDCAGLILRAAQLAGIPYFYKNSYTLAHYLKPIATTAALKEGDLIWIPGHVMVVSKLHPALLIEARGYPHGYGIVHEIALEKVFKGIKNYAQLMQASHKQKPLIRLDKKGQEMEKIKRFKVLSLESVWNQENI